MASKHKMTKAEAQTFENGYSKTHAAMLMTEAEARGCDCIPYQDWFTYNRWQALGYQVQRDEKGFCLTTYPTREEEDPKTGKKVKKSRPWRAYVFCRCQVKRKEERKAA